MLVGCNDLLSGLLQFLNIGCLLLLVRNRQLGGFPEANNVVNSQCAGTQTVFLFAPVHECTHRRKAIIVSPNIGSTHALGPVELVSGERKKIHSGLFDVDGQFPSYLRSISVE